MVKMVEDHYSIAEALLADVHETLQSDMAPSKSDSGTKSMTVQNWWDLTKNRKGTKRFDLLLRAP